MLILGATITASVPSKTAPKEAGMEDEETIDQGGVMFSEPTDVST